MKKGNILRYWFVLLVIYSFTFVNYYYYEILAPFQNYLGERYNIDSYQYGLLQGANYVGTILFALAIFGGIILDKIGVLKSILINLILLVIGSVLISISLSNIFTSTWIYNKLNSFLFDYSPHFKLIFIGLILVGIGFLNFSMIVFKVIKLWFPGKEYGLVYGINLSIIRLGTIASLFMGPLIFDSAGWPHPIYFGVVLYLFLFISLILYIPIHKKKFAEQEKKKPPHIPFKEIFKSPNFGLMALVIILFYAVLYTYIKFAPNILQNIYHKDLEESSDLASIFIIVSFFITPFMGSLCSKKNWPHKLLIMGSVSLLLGLISFLFKIHYLFPLIFMGISFSVFPPAIWYVLAQNTKTEIFGRTTGVIQWLQGIGLWITPIIIGKVLELTNHNVSPELIERGEKFLDYSWPIIIFLFYSILNILLTLLFIKNDSKKNLEKEFTSNLHPLNTK
ncbi:MAG: nitrate/nitrite transporter [Hyphomicrobiales bacterium]